ncbi:MAG: hypothetical protein KDI06_10860 [Calditrichaeota bacterium]|nr:hypothetical protein [Calditrichota bacterium]
MLIAMIKAFVIISVLMALWLGLQVLEMRRKGIAGNCDLLEGRTRCLGCALKGSCSKDAD